MKIATHQASLIVFLLGVGLLASYFASSFIAPAFPVSGLWKSSGVVLLGAFAALRGRTLVGAALLTCALGDFLLEVDPPEWTLGMAAFGLGHILYMVSFWTTARRLSQSPSERLGALLIILISALLAFWFLPGMGDLQRPGLVYQAIITAMTATAFLTQTPSRLRVGALVFMLSDCLIALGLYKNIQTPDGSVWATYAIAQSLIAWTDRKDQA